MFKGHQNIKKKKIQGLVTPNNSKVPKLTRERVMEAGGKKGKTLFHRRYELY